MNNDKNDKRGRDFRLKLARRALDGEAVDELCKETGVSRNALFAWVGRVAVYDDQAFSADRFKFPRTNMSWHNLERLRSMPANSTTRELARRWGISVGAARSMLGRAEERHLVTVEISWRNGLELHNWTYIGPESER